MLDNKKLNGTENDGSSASGPQSVVQRGNKENINTFYVFVHATVLALSMFQFGKFATSPLKDSRFSNTA